MRHAYVIVVAAAACFAANQASAQLSSLKDQSRFGYPLPPPRCTMNCVLPPEEFDHPYTGKLRIDTAKSQDELKEFCGSAYKPGITLGCSKPNVASNSCHIVMVPNEVIEHVGLTLNVMLRHEMAHCNGWPGDHPGKRSYNADKEAQRFPINPVWREYEWRR